jgi:hypothetical protein
MTYAPVIHELLKLREQNIVKSDQLKIRLRSETSFLKRDRILTEIEHTVITNREIKELLVEAYLAKITMKQIMQDLQR